MKHSGIRFFPAILVLFMLVLTGVAGAGKKDSCSHQWELVSSTAATCTESGAQEYRCSLCGKTKKERVRALGHDWSVCTVIRKPTCTEEGLTRCYCSRDRSHCEDKKQPALGHNWGDWTLVKNPDQAEPGIEIRTCSRCNSVEQRQVPPRLQQQNPYSLAAFVYPVPGVIGAITQTETGDTGRISLRFDCTLLNTGENTLWVRSWTDGDGKPLRKLKDEICLEAGQWLSFQLVREINGTEIIPQQSADGSTGVIESVFSFYGETAEGKQVCISNPASAEYRIFPESFASRLSPDFMMELAVNSAPENGDAYRIGNTVSWTVTVVSTAETPFSRILLQGTAPDGEAEITGLQPGETRTISFSHTVTRTDAENGYICLVQTACDEGDDPQSCMAVRTGPVIIPVAKDLP